MAKMTAYQLVEWGKPAEFVDVEIPTPGSDEVLIKMKGAGLCRSDLDIMDCPQTGLYASALPAGFTLGHENAGIVAQPGSAVKDLKEGDGVIVHHMHSCGYCPSCMEGLDISCRSYTAKSVPLTRGVGMDGGLAPYLVVPRRELIPLGKIDPIEAAPLTDAGVTSYRAIQTAIDRLKPGSTAVVIGIGGLGNYAIQLLKLLTPSRIIAVDVSPQRLQLARELGAHETIKASNTNVEEIMDRTGGVDVVFDIVGNDSTLALAAAVTMPQSKIVLVGMEGGSLRVGWGLIAPNCQFMISNGSTRSDLYQICELAQHGLLRNDIERFSFDGVEHAYEKLRQGQLKGRAVVTFK